MPVSSWVMFGKSPRPSGSAAPENRLAAMTAPAVRRAFGEVLPAIPGGTFLRVHDQRVAVEKHQFPQADAAAHGEREVEVVVARASGDRGQRLDVAE